MADRFSPSPSLSLTASPPSPSRCWRSLRGYGGHLISMANKVVAAMDSGPNSELLRRLIDQLPEHIRSGWHSFTDTQLPRINELRVSRVAGEGDCKASVWACIGQ